MSGTKECVFNKCHLPVNPNSELGFCSSHEQQNRFRLAQHTGSRRGRTHGDGAKTGFLGIHPLRQVRR